MHFAQTTNLTKSNALKWGTKTWETKTPVSLDLLGESFGQGGVLLEIRLSFIARTSQHHSMHTEQKLRGSCSECVRRPAGKKNGIQP